MFKPTSLENALTVLGALLESRKLRFELVVIGGGSLLLLGLLRRPTSDLDVLAGMRAGKLVPTHPLPADLMLAIQDTARALKLAPDWINTGPAGQLDAGLPPGFNGRLTTLKFGVGLCLHVASRFDQICFKLFAAVDQGPLSKHYSDLIALAPTESELRQARQWVAGQDVSDVFQAVLQRAAAEIQDRVHE